ncbi:MULTISPECIES: pyrroline-5-carboxylate reductase [Coprobacter]|jgi:pyrroline-5-carboxylate reductase|uniref:pyrroline-5-carboxylate reductase n=1 Tax=Coprobacter TaxID=1348911 RepID=UPI0025FC370E|nr:pyrroline-5-carboxylate reductase [Coprobacter fastidiosus]MBS6269449.1 pyrroline-5-carboxylate reductase [Tannerella sp.]
MKIAIIGAGNMGGAIAKGLAQGTIIKNSDIIVADPDIKKLEQLQNHASGISITTQNQEAVNCADAIILAVKPWLVSEVLGQLKIDPERQFLISIAAGVSLEQLAQITSSKMTIFRLVPNTAISELASMTLIASFNASEKQERQIADIFNEMGLAMLIPESQIAATTALTSCGIAYVLKYIYAATEAGVEMGVYPKAAMKMIAQSVKGAAELILNNDTHPAIEIDKVTTPGGITIKGLNELDHSGFTSAIIKAMKASK